MHTCILLYIHVTVLYYTLACFQKMKNVNVNVLIMFIIIQEVNIKISKKENRFLFFRDML